MRLVFRTRGYQNHETGFEDWRTGGIRRSDHEASAEGWRVIRRTRSEAEGCHNLEAYEIKTGGSQAMRLLF